ILSKPHELDRRFAGWTLSVSIGQSVGLPLAGLLAVLITPVAVPVLAGYTVAALHAVAGRRPVPAHPELP
ncbi:hypothetical protein ACWD50_25165, partial [Micromonospora sp. NPDC005113]